jgi:transposase
MTLEEDVVVLRAENGALRTENAALREQLGQLSERLEAVEKKKTPAPAFVRPNRVVPEKKGRLARAAEHNAGRGREEPTRIVRHALAACPDCGYALRGESIGRTREVIDLPEPVPVEVTEQQFITRHCPACDRWHMPRWEPTGQALGQGRIGVRLVSLIGYLRTTLRLPLRQIQDLLATLHQVRLSVGAIADVLRRLHIHGAAARADLHAQARRERVAHMDETGWRENGQNGYVWTLATTGPDAVRLFAYDRSRAGSVATDLLGDFSGHLVTDFSGGYNRYEGKHQRCWVHFLRDLHALKETYPHHALVVGWARAVRALYDQGRQDGSVLETSAQRDARAQRLGTRATRLGLRYAGPHNKGHPCHALAQRLLRHRGELFEFLRVSGLAPDNNLAERTIRPFVIARKISGGSRSPEGSETRMGLASLFATWQARALNPFQACLSLLSQPPLQQI